MRRLSRKRRERIILAFVRVTQGYPVTRSLSGLLMALREHVPDVTEAEVRKSIAWSLRWSRRSAAEFERRLRSARTKSGADRCVLG